MRKPFSVRQLTAVAAATALIAVCSWISIPLPSMVPFTLQTFAVCLAAALLGPQSGVFSVLCYILLAAAGVPVLSGFRGGAAALLGVTGGYVLGFVFTAAVVGLAARRWGRRPGPLFGAMAVGVLICYAFGTAWFILVYTRTTGPVSVLTALGWCVLPYLAPDAVKLALAAFLAGRLYPLIRREGVAP